MKNVATSELPGTNRPQRRKCMRRRNRCFKRSCTVYAIVCQRGRVYAELVWQFLEEAYKVLEVEPTATDDEVRAAYRRLALKHHPDRVATLGEDIRKAAEEKFQSINNAKERIYKARGMK